MTEIVWDSPGALQYYAGVDRGVFYPATGPGVPWNGLTSVKEDEEGSNQSVIYIDGQKTINQVDLGTFSATIEAFTYPDEFLAYDGFSSQNNLIYSAQKRNSFGLSYRSLVGSDGRYLLHLVYNCLVKPTNKDRNTLDDSADISPLSWDLTTLPVALPYDRPTSHFAIDSGFVIPEVLTSIENILYGSDTSTSRFPTIQELLSIFEANAVFIVVNNGDGTATVTGPDDAVYQDQTDPTKWTLDYISVIQQSENTYRAHSY